MKSSTSELELPKNRVSWESRGEGGHRVPETQDTSKGYGGTLPCDFVIQNCEDFKVHKTRDFSGLYPSSHPSTPIPLFPRTFLTGLCL